MEKWTMLYWDFYWDLYLTWIQFWFFSGEIVKITKHGVESMCVYPRPEGDPTAFCIFEYVYFARPDSMFEGRFLFIWGMNGLVI